MQAFSTPILNTYSLVKGFVCIVFTCQKHVAELQDMILDIAEKVAVLQNLWGVIA